MKLAQRLINKLKMSEDFDNDTIADIIEDFVQTINPSEKAKFMSTLLNTLKRFNPGSNESLRSIILRMPKDDAFKLYKDLMKFNYGYVSDNRR